MAYCPIDDIECEEEKCNLKGKCTDRLAEKPQQSGSIAGLDAIPRPLEPVLVKIFTLTDLGAYIYHEVVYHDGKGWRGYGGSKTFEDGEKVTKWKYISDCI